MLDRLKDRLIDDWRHAWRLSSVRLAALAAAIVGAVTAQPQILLGLLAYVPDRFRPVAVIASALITFVIPTILRLWKQENRNG